MPTTFSPLKSTAALAIAGALSLSGLPALAWDWTPGKAVIGSGRVSKTQRQLSGFKGLALELPASVEIVQDDTEGVLIETDDNIAPLIETVVENGQLKIRPARRFTAFKTKTTRITVHARSMDSISISGSGQVKAQTLRSAALATQISGSGDIHIATLDADTLSLSISGNGDFQASGRADSVQSSISGSGNIKTARLAAKNVQLSIAGSGNAQVWASQTLSINIAGSGNVDYYGDAAVSQTVMGSGRIRKVDATANPGS